MIHTIDNPYSKSGGLSILFGNLAEKGCVVKTAGVSPKMLKHKGPAVVFESEEDAGIGILAGKVKEGDVVVIRYEGPKGGPGMQEMLAPTSYIMDAGSARKSRWSRTDVSAVAHAAPVSGTSAPKPPPEEPLH